MDYEKRCNELIDAIKVMMEANPHDEGLQNWVHDNVPELTESEDERIRKELIKFVKVNIPDEERYIAWLEKQSEPVDKGEISDGFHTFNELYYYRMLYNAAFFNMLPKEWVHKSKKHNDGEECFGGGWFIVMANLPTGQISNHYELKDWDLFQIPEKERADKWDGHTPQEAAERLHKFLLEKQVPFDKEKMLIGARKDVASSIITYLDRNTLGMCLSNMECEDLVNAVVDSDWGKVYDYMKKKLEKQGDKPQGKTAIEAIKEEKVDNANIVKSKFKGGDWVVTDKYGTIQIGAVNSFYYTLNNGMDFSTSYANKYWHLWTIKDIKDGDILSNGKMIVIFKKFEEPPYRLSLIAYAGLDITGDIQITDGTWQLGIDKVHPANSDERKHLFKMLKGKGLEWDEEHKVVKGIKNE